MENLLAKYTGTVSALTATATGLLIGGPCVVRGLHAVRSSGSGASVIEFRDGAAGSLLLDLRERSGAGPTLEVPAGGISFSNGVHLTITNIDAVTVFFQR